MSKLLRWSAGALGVALVIGIVGKSRAAITSVSTTPEALSSYAWTGTPDYVSIDNPGLLVSPGPNTNQNFTSPSGADHTTALAETFTPQTGSTYGAPNNHGFTIGNIAMFAAGGHPNIVNTMHLYDITSTLQNGPPNSSVGNTTYSINGLTDMLGGGSGDAFTWNPGTVPSGDFAFYTIFAINDAPVIQLDHTYALEITTDQSQPGGDLFNFRWGRIGPSPTDPGGQGMGATDASAATTRLTNLGLGLSGGAPRTNTLAFNVAVPEPATVVLLGLAGPGLLWVARRRKG